MREYLSLAVAVLARPLRSPAAPRHVQIDISTRCNLRCSMCCAKKIILPKEDNRFMPLDEFRRIIDRNRPWSVNLAANGEPLLHPAFDDMVRYAKSKHITVIASTNLAMAPEHIVRAVDSGLDILKVSIDGAVPATYERIRGVSHARLIENLRHLRSARQHRRSGTPDVRFDFVIMKENYREISGFLDFCRSWDVRHVYFHPIDVREYEQARKERSVYGVDHDELTRILRQAEGDARAAGMRTNLKTLLERQAILAALYAPGKRPAIRRRVCLLPWFGLFVSISGETSPCCALYPGRDGSLGNILTQPLEEVWNGEAAQTLRRRFARRENYGVYEACRYCMPMDMGVLRAAASTFPGYVRGLLKGRTS
jgi:MoaA/NifB/PqqE/SkfB family radical SAM enzyme